MPWSRKRSCLEGKYSSKHARQDRQRGKGKRDVKERSFLAAIYVHGVVWAAYTDALHRERERMGHVHVCISILHVHTGTGRVIAGVSRHSIHIHTHTHNHTCKTEYRCIQTPSQSQSQHSTEHRSIPNADPGSAPDSVEAPAVTNLSVCHE